MENRKQHHLDTKRLIHAASTYQILYQYRAKAWMVWLITGLT